MTAQADTFTDRRRPCRFGQLPMELLDDVPAAVVLRRLPVPALAVSDDGAVLFASDAFAAMVGRSPATMSLTELSQVLPWIGGGGAVATMRAHANQIVDVTHSDGSTVLALMSESVMLRHDDPVALSTFVDVSEQIWVGGGRGVSEARWWAGQIIVRHRRTGLRSSFL
jgi:PAS domain-containing protein